MNRAVTKACAACGVLYGPKPYHDAWRWRRSRVCSQRCQRVLSGTTRKRSVSDRFDTQYVPEPNTGCWLWTGSLDAKGYGHIHIMVRGAALAHRVSWERHRGPIPDGMVIDHLCRVRSCVNPDHLRVVTPRVNVLENSLSLPAMQVRRNACKYGHPYEGANVAFTKHGARRCKVCAARATRVWRATKEASPCAS